MLTVSAQAFDGKVAVGELLTGSGAVRIRDHRLAETEPDFRSGETVLIATAGDSRNAAPVLRGKNIAVCRASADRSEPFDDTGVEA